MSTMENIRAKIKRRFSHKDPNPNLDDYDSGDEETSEFVSKEADEAEKGGHDSGRPGTLLNRMISHGNKKTEDQLAREAAAANSQAGGADQVATQR